LLLNVTLLLSHSLTSAILLCIFLSLPRSPLFLPHFFFSMLRRPPRSTLFPYTTLSDLLYRFKYIEFIFICQIIFLFISIAKDPHTFKYVGLLFNLYYCLPFNFSDFSRLCSCKVNFCTCF